MFLHLIPRVDLECSIFEEIVSYRVLFCRHWVDEDLESKDIKINMMERIIILEKGNWIMKIVSALCPLCLLTSRVESQDEILV